MDNDGDEELLEVVGGGVPGDTHTFRLFENPGHGNDWISVRLVGVKANRPGIGAKIKVTVPYGYQLAEDGKHLAEEPTEQALTNRSRSACVICSIPLVSNLQNPSCQ